MVRIHREAAVEVQKAVVYFWWFRYKVGDFRVFPRTLQKTDEGITIKHWKKLTTLLRHKWYVFLECCRMGIPWLGITHDLSKFLPDEWFPYTDWFYGRGENKTAFHRSYLKHLHRNKHHWQHWILDMRDTVIVLDMPVKYRKEMLADWIGAGKAYKNKDSAEAWYIKIRNCLLLHENVRAWIERELWQRDSSTQ